MDKIDITLVLATGMFMIALVNLVIILIEKIKK